MNTVEAKAVNPFESAFTLCGVDFNPISPPALAVCKRRGNVIICDNSTRDQSEIEAAGELLYICHIGQEGRVKNRSTEDAEWDKLVHEFIAGLPDEIMSEFTAMLATLARRKNEEAPVES